jgi:flagellar hook protein FlgE
LTYTVGAGSTLDELNTFLNQALGIDTSISSGASTPGATLLPGASGTDPANSRRLRIEGNVGVQNALSLTGTTFGTNLAYQESTPAVGESVYTSFTVYDSLGAPLQINMVTVLEGKTNTGTNWRFYAYSGNDTDAATFDPTGATEGMRLGTGVISFDTSGKLTTATALPVSVDRDLTGAGDPLSFGVDFSRMNALADSAANSSNMFAEADGKPIGTLTSFSIGSNGQITGSFDNGLQETLGQMAVATFDNVEGLLDKGGNMYVTSGNAGTPKITAPLQLGAGGVRSGTLELSNVDLSDEFVNLIIASTGFSAASRVITTSDQLLTELLNASR